MTNTLSSTQLLNFCVLFFLSLSFSFALHSTEKEVVLEGCLGLNMSLVFVWEFECDRRGESDEGQRTERS